MDVKVIWAVGSAAVAVVVGTWQGHDYINTNYASKEEVLVAGGKADFVIDRQMEAVINEISYLERKAVLTPGEIERLRYLRRQLELMQQLRSGKK